MEIVLWNCFAISFICFVFSYVQLTRKNKLELKNNKSSFSVIIPNNKNEKSKQFLKYYKKLRRGSFVNAFKNCPIYFSKKIHGNKINFISNFNFTQIFANKNDQFFENIILNNLEHQLLKNRTIIVNHNKQNIVVGNKFIFHNCSYDYHVTKEFTVLTKTIINPIHNMFITEINLKNLTFKEMDFNILQKTILNKSNYLFKHDKQNHETSFVLNNSFIVNKVLNKSSYNKFYSKVGNKSREEIELNHYQLMPHEKLTLYLVTGVDVPLNHQITMQHINTCFKLNSQEYNNYIKNVNSKTKGLICHIIKKSKNYYCNLSLAKTQLKNKNFFIHPLGLEIFNKKLYVEDRFEKEINEIKKLFLLLNYPIEIVYVKHTENGLTLVNNKPMQTTLQNNIISALNINLPTSYLKSELEFVTNPFGVKLKNFFKYNKPLKWETCVEIKNNAVYLKNLRTKEVKQLFDSCCNKINTNLFFKVETKVQYLNHLISKFLPKKIYQLFLKSNETNLYDFIEKEDITYLQNYHYNYVIKLLINSRQFVALYKFLVQEVLGIKIVGDVVKINKNYQCIGKFVVGINGKSFTKYNNVNNTYFVYDNIIYHNVNLIKLTKQKNINSLEILN